MPVHDWTRVDAGIFRHFYLGWVGGIAGVLNRGLLPPDYYALIEPIAGRIGPVALNLPPADASTDLPEESPGGIPDPYARKARAIVVRQISDHRAVAMCEIVSPGNKHSRQALRSFIERAVSVLRSGIHLLVVDLFPPGPGDPQGIHRAIWDEIVEEDFTLPRGKPLTLVSYIGGPTLQAFIEPISVGSTLPVMALFLTPETYVPVPLEATYQSAWDAVPSYWRERISESGGTGDHP